MTSKKRIFFVLFFLFHFSHLFSENPFEFDYSISSSIMNSDFVNIQNELRKINIDALIVKLYEEYNDPDPVPMSHFYYRCMKGVKQTLIDENRNLLPIKTLDKINKGGKRCIVSCISYDSNYLDLVNTQRKALKAVGFDGYFYAVQGGFPNPTGIEALWAGVPYCFKLFAMIEAYQLGFSSVIWLDSPMLPLKNPSPLFDLLERHGALLVEEGMSKNNRYILPATRNLLQQCTNVDVYSSTFIRTMVFGLKMDSELCQELINGYYKMVSLGTPFLSCFPEEFVLTAILGQEQFKRWKGHVVENRIQYGSSDEIITFSYPRKRRASKVYFYHRGHK